MGGEIESGNKKEFFNKNVCIDMEYFNNNRDNTRNVFDLILELTAFDTYNNIECEFATFCRFYKIKDNEHKKNEKYDLQILKQKLKIMGEWYVIHDAFGLGGSNSDEKYINIKCVFIYILIKI